MRLSYSIILLAFFFAASSHGAPIDNLSTISPVGLPLAGTLPSLASTLPLDGLTLVNPPAGDNGFFDLDSLPAMDNILPGLLSKRSLGNLEGEALQLSNNALAPVMGVVNNVMPTILGSVPVLGNINPLSTVDGLLPMINMKRSLEQLPTEALSSAMGLIENDVPAILSSVPGLGNINPLSTVDGLPQMINLKRQLGQLPSEALASVMGVVNGVIPTALGTVADVGSIIPTALGTVADVGSIIPSAADGLLPMLNLKRNLNQLPTEALSPFMGMIENDVPATLGSVPVFGNIDPLSPVNDLLPMIHMKRSLQQLPSEVLAPAMGLVNDVIPTTLDTVSGLVALPVGILDNLL